MTAQGRKGSGKTAKLGSSAQRGLTLTFNPSVLRWCRTRAQIDTKTLAAKMGVNEAAVAEWEFSGELRFTRAEKLAQVTHTPLGYLYLDAPLPEPFPLSDFRTIGSHGIRQPSTELLDVVYGAKRRQAWYRQYLLANQAAPLEFVGSLKQDVPPVEAAAKICGDMGLDSAARQENDRFDSLRPLVACIEANGVMVMRNGIVDNNTHRGLQVDEFRGFALSDDLAPLIFINASDATAAQMFTLMHELVHLWLGVSGISNLHETYADNNGVERYCNAVAAEILVPERALREQWDAVKERDYLYKLTRAFKVSSLVILHRLRDIEALDEGTFRSLFRQQIALASRSRSRSRSGGNFYATLGARLGARFPRALIESTLEGRTLYREAFQLLGIKKGETFQQLTETVLLSS